MHILKTGLVLIISVFLTIPLFANNIFYEANKSLERVGLKEILAMDKISLEEADFRLDPDFTIGYGDSVEVNFWGKIEANYNLQINRNGNIIIPFLGKINIVGLTLNGAKEVVRENLDKKFILVFTPVKKNYSEKFDKKSWREIIIVVYYQEKPKSCISTT